MRVAIDARLTSTRNTGDTSYWRGLLRGLAALPFEGEVLLFTDREPWAEGPSDPRFRWVHVPARSSRWWSLATFPQAARRHRAQVVHTQYNLSPLVRRGVITVHDVSFFVDPAWFSPRDAFILRTQLPGSIARARRVLTVSETSRREIEQFIPAASGKVVVTPNALGENIRPLSLEDASARRARLGVTEPYVLTVGTRWKRKNVQLAVDAASDAGVPLVMTGQTEAGEVQPARTTVTVGYVDDADLTALYQGGALYLAPAFHEGFGIPVLEAFACRCPVVCSTGGALPEVAGGAAEVVPSFDRRDWAAAIQRLMGDSSKLGEMRRRGELRVKDFDWRRTAQLTWDSYREAAR